MLATVRSTGSEYEPKKSQSGRTGFSYLCKGAYKSNLIPCANGNLVV